MSTRSKAAAALASAGILLVGWNVGTANGKTLTTTTSAGTGTGTTVAAGTNAGTTSSGTSGATGTYTGTTESDRFGTITVTVTLANGKITDVTYKTTVRDNHSAQIEARAIPTLKAAVLAANSADVSTVSGATYTSNKYLSSLQSALDKAA
ncbi:MAG: FMN-binding protein [Actinomycetales bacterium]|nr:FMN-binding protein [Candidatus Phosphoribacter baldrii]